MIPVIDMLRRFGFKVFWGCVPVDLLRASGAEQANYSLSRSMTAKALNIDLVHKHFPT